MTAKVIVLDFDGTLVDSNPIKLKAFDVCFAEDIPAHPEILTYCYANHHTPRWEKFRHVTENILKRAYTKEIEAKLAKRYEDATTQAIINAKEIPGALEYISNETRPLFLLSSTPHQYLIQIVEGRGWMKYFAQVQGAPVKKSEWIQNLAKQRGLSIDELLFIGDTVEDLQSAREAGCLFIGVANDALPAHGVTYMKDFTQMRVAA